MEREAEAVGVVLKEVSLDDKYALDTARAYMTGIEALVRLPMDWLEQHGDTLTQLQEIRAAGDGRLGAHTLPLVSAR